MVVARDGPRLLGRNWLCYIQLDWKKIHAVSKSLKLIDLLHDNSHLLREELGEIQHYEASLQIRPDVCPRFFKARLVPFAIKPSIEDELDELEASGVIKKVEHSQWAAPIVPVPKKNGKFRICGDYNATVNQVLDVDQYPLPKPDDLFATLAGEKMFSKLELSQVYQQLTPLRRINQVCYYQHSPWVVSKYLTAIWGCLCTCTLPEAHGHCVARYTSCNLLY